MVSKYLKSGLKKKIFFLNFSFTKLNFQFQIEHLIWIEIEMWNLTLNFKIEISISIKLKLHFPKAKPKLPSGRLNWPSAACKCCQTARRMAKLMPNAGTIWKMADSWASAPSFIAACTISRLNSPLLFGDSISASTFLHCHRWNIRSVWQKNKKKTKNDAITNSTTPLPANDMLKYTDSISQSSLLISDIAAFNVPPSKHLAKEKTKKKQKQFVYFSFCTKGTWRTWRRRSQRRPRRQNSASSASLCSHPPPGHNWRRTVSFFAHCAGRQKK